MNLVQKLMVGMTFILLASTTICGFYIRFSKDKLVDYNSSLNFHGGIAMISILFTVITVFMMYKSVVSS